MLDLKKIDKKFNEILASFDEAKLQQWIDFSNTREQLELLELGHSVNVIVEQSTPNYINPQELLVKVNLETAGENNYALAA
ncbi:hypothetical protein [Flavobacterium macacae]|uniref:Uncharacterized protein n=1 Tax=Flavobacterium macacae TaxID=2488993 RepID=A0A3P3WAL8_9FLAO|nr:hypothetical protein [Flavobacterium macacae]RRJ91468.1 hypothetical protein EG849_08745 [Flavobacterium macacae]